MKKINLFFLAGILFIYFLNTSCGENTAKINQPTVDSTTTIEKNEIKKTSSLVTLNYEEKKKLNVFFSNFSEINLQTISSKKLNNTDLIYFGVYHEYINNYKHFESINGKAKIKKEYVSKAVAKYFGITISKDQSIDEIEFANDYYIISEASGETFMFSQIESIVDNGAAADSFGNLFTATVNVYSATSGWVGNVHGNKVEWQNKTPEDVPELSYKVTAVIKKGASEEGNFCYLIDYKRMDQQSL